MVNLKDLLRTRIVVDMIRSVQSTSRWKIVVVDAGSLKIINTSCKMTDILEENVTLIEDISRKRTSYSQKDAIYFLSATAESVASLIGDFSGTKPMYATAHVFFTSALADALFEKIKRATGLTPFIKTLRELNIDFIDIHRRCTKVIFYVIQPRDSSCPERRYYLNGETASFAIFISRRNALHTIPRSCGREKESFCETGKHSPNRARRDEEVRPRIPSQEFI